MSTLTIRLPDDKHERLNALAKSNSISSNKLMDGLVSMGTHLDALRAAFGQGG